MRQISPVLMNSPFKNHLLNALRSDADWAKLRVAHHLQPGVVTYDNEDGSKTTYLLPLEAIAKMRKTAEGRPIVGSSGGFDHRDVKPEEFKTGDADGVVVESFANPEKGWEDIRFMVWDPETKSKCDEGYEFSCAYVPTEVDETPGLWHNVPYDAIILDGTYTHFALVPNPRYVGAEVYNSTRGGLMNKFLKVILSSVPLSKLKEVVNSLAEDDVKKRAAVSPEKGNADTPVEADEEARQKKIAEEKERTEAGDNPRKSEGASKLPLGGGDVLPDPALVAAGVDVSGANKTKETPPVETPAAEPEKPKEVVAAAEPEPVKPLEEKPEETPAEVVASAATPEAPKPPEPEVPQPNTTEVPEPPKPEVPNSSDGKCPVCNETAPSTPVDGKPGMVSCSKCTGVYQVPNSNSTPKFKVGDSVTTPESCSIPSSDGEVAEVRGENVLIEFSSGERVLCKASECTGENENSAPDPEKEKENADAIDSWQKHLDSCDTCQNKYVRNKGKFCDAGEKLFQEKLVQEDQLKNTSLDSGALREHIAKNYKKELLSGTYSPELQALLEKGAKQLGCDVARYARQARGDARTPEVPEPAPEKPAPKPVSNTHVVFVNSVGGQHEIMVRRGSEESGTGLKYPTLSEAVGRGKVVAQEAGVTFEEKKNDDGINLKVNPDRLCECGEKKSEHDPSTMLCLAQDCECEGFQKGATRTDASVARRAQAGNSLEAVCPSCTGTMQPDADSPTPKVRCTDCSKVVEGLEAIAKLTRAENSVKNSKAPADHPEYQEYFTYLDKLRTAKNGPNMFGAGSYLQSKFGLDKIKAREVLQSWMDNFSQENSLGEPHARPLDNAADRCDLCKHPELSHWDEGKLTYCCETPKKGEKKMGSKGGSGTCGCEGDPGMRTDAGKGVDVGHYNSGDKFSIPTGNSQLIFGIEGKAGEEFEADGKTLRLPKGRYRVVAKVDDEAHSGPWGSFSDLTVEKINASPSPEPPSEEAMETPEEEALEQLAISLCPECGSEGKQVGELGGSLYMKCSSGHSYGADEPEKKDGALEEKVNALNSCPACYHGIVGHGKFGCDLKNCACSQTGVELKNMRAKGLIPADDLGRRLWHDTPRSRRKELLNSRVKLGPGKMFPGFWANKSWDELPAEVRRDLVKGGRK